MKLYDEVKRIEALGYNEQNAQSKLGQDIILKAIADSGMSRNATIKGGVVMRSISNDARRATQDMDIDFIRYSIADEDIRKFISKLNCIESLDIKIVEPIEELNHQDYKGRRVRISITDVKGTAINLKMDIGVHSDLSIEQDIYAFDVGFQEDAVSLLINSPAQMIAEKLKSMVRFGSRSTRYKDLFDICYLSEYADNTRLIYCIEKYIFEDETLRTINNISDIVRRLERMFADDNYLKELKKANKNWLDISTDEAIEKLKALVSSLQVLSGT